MSVRGGTFLNAAAVVVGVAAIYLAFELGRLRAGYSIVDHRRATATLVAERDADRSAAEELRRRVAILETSVEIDRKTYSEIESSLSELEAQIQAQEEELVFYRGIVAPQDAEPGLRVQDLEVVPQDAERRYLVSVVLAQGIVHSRDAEGVVKLQLEGMRDGASVSLDLADLAVAGDSDTSPERYDMTYKFRYFQGLEAMFELPVGFEPQRLNVELAPAEARAEHVTRSFEWSAVVR